ncbi:MAG: hypothetical protein U0X39_09930 [Bacteroidales bacterium]
MKRKLIRLLLILIPVIFICPGYAYSSVPDTTRPTISAVRINRPVTLSGKLDDPLWLQSMPVELKYEINPGENKPARQKTEAMILYDNEKLYIGFRCYDTLPGAIRAHLTDRDKIFSDDYVIVTLDTYNNYQRGFEFAVNPYGIQGDLLMMGTGNEDSSYDLVWYSAAARNSEGWTAELAIPFKALTFSNKNVQDWTISLLRCVPRNNRYMLAWTPLDRNNPSYMAQGGTVTGIQGIKPGNSLDFLPYAMFEQSGTKKDISDPVSAIERSKVKARIGGGVTWSPGPNTTINAVVNPDFSQIESDADQIEVNTTFALYYDEKRPFFMSGMDLLQTPMYYSRTINNPLFASKVNGKTGNLSYLALGAYDRNTAITVPGEEQSNTVTSDLQSYVGVARARYDLGNENFFGALVLSRNVEDGHNYLGGLDWSFKFWKNWYWQGELFLTDTREMNDTLLFKSDREFGSTGHDAGFNGERYLGTGLHLALFRSGRNYSFTLVQNNFSPTFQTYNGLFPEVNTRQSYMNHNYTFQINGKIIQRIRLGANLQATTNFDNVFKELVFQPQFAINMIGQTRFNVSYAAINRERFRNVFFTDVNRWFLNFSTTPVRGFTLEMEGQVGRFIYRSSVPEKGKGYNFTTALSVEPMPRLKASFEWSTAKLTETDGSDEYYNGHIFRNITTFQFSRKLFLREIAQYNTFSKSFSIYPLVSYKFNAFTMFCAGMTRDMMDYNQADYSFRTTGYQYFVKLQYLFSR